MSHLGVNLVLCGTPRSPRSTPQEEQIQWLVAAVMEAVACVLCDCPLASGGGSPASATDVVFLPLFLCEPPPWDGA
jgi:hypothetical protein